MDWSLLNGDPAPGDVGGIRASGATLQSLANDVGDVLSGVRRETGGCGPQRWSGPAADAFRDRAQKLPDQLWKAEDSFEQAAGALAHYANLLQSDQADALRALRQASDAIAARAAAAGQRDAHQQQLNAVHQAQTRVGANLAQLAVWRRAALVTGDTAAVQNYLHQEAVQRADQRRLSDDALSLGNDVRRFQSQVDAAQGALDAARRTAADIRQRQHAAGQELTTALQTAHQAGINKTWLDEAEHIVDDYGPIIQDALSKASLVCEVGAMIPFLTPVLGPAAVVLGVASGVVGLAVHLDKFREGKYPMNAMGLTHFGVDVLGDGLSILPGVEGLATVSKSAKALSAVEEVDKVVPYVSAVQGEAQAFFDAEDKHENVFSAMVWATAENAGGQIAQHSIAGIAHHSTKSAEALESFSKSYGRTDLPDRNLVVSLGMSGQQKAGQFSFGGTRIMKSSDVSEDVNTLVEAGHAVLGSGEELYGQLTESR